MDRGQEQERGQGQVRAGKERRLAMAEEIRKLELVRDRLLGVEEITKTYPEGHEMRTRLDDLNLERVISAVEEELTDLWDRTLHPRGT